MRLCDLDNNSSICEIFRCNYIDLNNNRSQQWMYSTLFILEANIFHHLFTAEFYKNSTYHHAPRLFRHNSSIGCFIVTYASSYPIFHWYQGCCNQFHTLFPCPRVSITDIYCWTSIPHYTQAISGVGRERFWWQGSKVLKSHYLSMSFCLGFLSLLLTFLLVAVLLLVQLEVFVVWFWLLLHSWRCYIKVCTLYMNSGHLFCAITTYCQW